MLPVLLASILLACTPSTDDPTPPGPGGDGGSSDGGSADGGSGDGGADGGADGGSGDGGSGDGGADGGADGGSGDGGADGGADGGSGDGGAPQPVAVYILTGQSNSLGTTSYEGDEEADYGPGSHAADAASPFFWSNVDAGNTRYPPRLYGDSEGAIVTLQMQQGAGVDPTFWGPEFGLARALYDADTLDGDFRELLIIKASRGGGGNTYWDQDTFDVVPSAGHMWGHLVDTTDLALAELEAEGKAFELRGFLYLQGESNSTAEADVAGERLADLVDNIAAHVEGIAPGSTARMHTVVGEIAASTSTSPRSTTTDQQRALAEKDPDITFVETSDLPLKKDGIHFGRDAKLEIGRRFAEVLLEGER